MGILSIETVDFDVEDDYPTSIAEIAETSSSSSGAAAIENLTEKELPAFL